MHALTYRKKHLNPVVSSESIAEFLQEVDFVLVSLKRPSSLQTLSPGSSWTKTVSSEPNEEGASRHLLIERFWEEVFLVLVGPEGPSSWTTV